MDSVAQDIVIIRGLERLVVPRTLLDGASLSLGISCSRARMLSGAHLQTQLTCTVRCMGKTHTVKTESSMLLPRPHLLVPI